MSNHAVVKAENVSKTYTDGQRKTTVLHNVSLHVDPGECVAVIGTSGSGKSTLLHLLGGLDKPDPGSKVLINNQSIHELKVTDQSALRNQSIGMVYQFHHLLPEFSAVENVALPAIMAGKTAAEAQHDAQNILALVNMDHRIRHKPSELSGGERQRVAIARALINKPSIVLADEPTGNLDSKTAKITFDLMLQLNRTSKSALLIVTHDSAMASLADRVLELQDGRLIKNPDEQGVAS